MNRSYSLSATVPFLDGLTEPVESLDRAEPTVQIKPEDTLDRAPIA
jgi:hypothetical protein